MTPKTNERKLWFSFFVRFALYLRVNRSTQSSVRLTASGACAHAWRMVCQRNERIGSVRRPARWLFVEWLGWRCCAPFAIVSSYGESQAFLYIPAAWLRVEMHESHHSQHAAPKLAILIRVSFVFASSIDRAHHGDETMRDGMTTATPSSIRTLSNRTEYRAAPVFRFHFPSPSCDIFTEFISRHPNARRRIQHSSVILCINLYCVRVCAFTPRTK